MSKAKTRRGKGWPTLRAAKSNSTVATVILSRSLSLPDSDDCAPGATRQDTIEPHNQQRTLLLCGQEALLLLGRHFDGA